MYWNVTCTMAVGLTAFVLADSGYFEIHQSLMLAVSVGIFGGALAVAASK